MKFTKDDARKELSTQMTAKGEKLNLSERSLNEQLDALIPLVANEEMELADFVTKVLPIFKTADANVRNDVSAGINDTRRQILLRHMLTLKRKRAARVIANLRSVLRLLRSSSLKAKRLHA